MFTKLFVILINYYRRMKQEFNSKKPCNGLKKEYLSFISSYAKNKTKGLLCRLKEMPKGKEMFLFIN